MKAEKSKLYSSDSETEKKRKSSKRQHKTIVQTKRLKITNETFKTPRQIFTS